jgi:hypothetical protein
MPRYITITVDNEVMEVMECRDPKHQEEMFHKVLTDLNPSSTITYNRTLGEATVTSRDSKHFTHVQCVPSLTEDTVRRPLTPEELDLFDCQLDHAKTQVKTVLWSRAGDGTHLISLGSIDEITSVHILLRRIFEAGIVRNQVEMQRVMGIH